jgi:hypothetical protein
MFESALSPFAVNISLNMDTTPLNSDSYDWASDDDEPDNGDQSDILDITERQVCGEFPCNNIPTQKHLRNTDIQIP